MANGTSGHSFGAQGQTALYPFFFFFFISQMNICAMKRNRVLTEAQSNNVKVFPRPLSRVNGWTPPLHSFQAITWTTYLAMSIVTFGIFIPFLPPSWKHAANLVMGGVFMFHLIVHLTAITIDPAATSVRLKKDYSEPVPTFDRSKHAHVIQNEYCNLCGVTVGKKAKHCSACNKCISGFDHHCKWLNNCVGSRNYWWFFCSVASAALGLLGVMVILLYIFIQHFVNAEELRTDPLYEEISSKDIWLLFLPLWPVPVKTPVFLSIVVVVFLPAIASFVPLVHLLRFHCYLIAKNLSTFDYTVQKGSRKSLHPEEKKELPLQKKGSLPQEKSNRSVSQSSPRRESQKSVLSTLSQQSSIILINYVKEALIAATEVVKAL
ncbi:palmitoyltransferase ZDHHC11-like [Acomys russatus]|uniref:palmitoyltransferase ZDHHC11-like n=1 Tax=Acomys russatus TaxID=60746 RepID=UPI0021E2F42F|nr:palmitoyltransferase ZDHHC11-like [Acomys russatus]